MSVGLRGRVGERISRVGATARLVARGLRARHEPIFDGRAPRRRIAVERSGIVPEVGRVSRYLAATGAERIAAFTGDEGVLPPLFSATWESALFIELLSGLPTPLPFGTVVHAGGEALCLRPLRSQDRIRCRVELEGVETTQKGTRLTLGIRNWNARGQLCSEGTAVFLVRRRAPPHGSATRSREVEDGAEWSELARWALGGGEGRKYARASGDYNPIHLWSWSARPFGFARPILHGFCIQARVAHSLIEHRYGGDAAALRRIAVHFRAPLPLPAKVRLLVAEGDDQPARFQVVGEASAPVFAEGSFGGG